MDIQLDDLPHTRVRDTYRALRAALDTLTLALTRQDAGYAHWVAQAPEDLEQHRSPRETIIWIYSQMYFQKGISATDKDTSTRDARHTHHRPGFLATHPLTLSLAIEVNKAKLAFKEAMLDVKDKHQRKQLPATLFDDFAKRDPCQAEVLRHAGLSCIHLVEAYRLIPVLMHTPRRIGFSWLTKSKTITPVSYDKVASIIEFDGGAGQRRLFEEKHAGEAWFANVRPSQPHLRANITLAHTRLPPVPASLPILYPAVPGVAPPMFVPVPYDPDQANSVRLDRSDKGVDYAHPILLKKKTTTDEKTKDDAHTDIGIYPYLKDLKVKPLLRQKRGKKSANIGD